MYQQKTKFNFDLINGLFSKEDTLKILFTLINNKIKFHQMELFSASEKYGEERQISKNRIAELQNCKNQLEDFIKSLENSKLLNLNANIQIEAL